VANTCGSLRKRRSRENQLNDILVKGNGGAGKNGKLIPKKARIRRRPALETQTPGQREGRSLRQHNLANMGRVQRSLFSFRGAGHQTGRVTQRCGGV